MNEVEGLSGGERRGRGVRRKTGNKYCCELLIFPFYFNYPCNSGQKVRKGLRGDVKKTVSFRLCALQSQGPPHSQAFVVKLPVFVVGFFFLIIP